MRSIVPVVYALLLLPSVLFAWSGDGHQIVALIAEDHLTPQAQAGIHELLGKDVNIPDAEIASWADNYRREHRETAPWHYVDIPVDADTFDEGRDGKNGNNVIDKIGDFEKVLADKTAPIEKRAEALKFLVHLVGDPHQPLHCADRHGDRGGNSRLVFYLDRPRATNLHMVWDSTILIQRRGTVRIAAYADGLNTSIKPEQLAAWQKGTPSDWANESHLVARDAAYAGVPADGPTTKASMRSSSTRMRWSSSSSWNGAVFGWRWC